MRGCFELNGRLKSSVGLGAITLALATLSFATGANAQASTDDGADSQEIVVTGTLVRGIAPAGTNVVGVTQEQIKTTGAATTSELLRTIPQMGTFATISGAPQPVGTAQTTNRPSLRGGLPGFNSSGGSTTLVLLDGHRIVGMGIETTTPDPDIVPPGAMQRAEVVTDGGSAIYGSDAVAGVINFITRKDFDGVETNARYGIGDSYHTFDANLTVGKKWDTGSAYISYNYSEHSAIFGRDRDYIHTPKTASSLNSTSPQALTSLQCSPGNVVVGNDVYALPYAAGAAKIGTANQCDTSATGVLTPTERRHSIMAGLSQHLSDTLQIDLQAFYMNRKTDFFGGGGSPQSATVSSSNPFFAAHRIADESQQLVYFQVPEGTHPYGQKVGLEAYGLTETLTANLTSNWQLRVLGSYSQSLTTSQSWGINTTALTNALAATDPSVAFNPYNPSATNPATLAAISNFGNFGRARQTMFNTRAIIDGDLFPLPAGAVKIAAGVEYTWEGYRPQKGDTVVGAENSGYAGLSLGGTVIVPAYDPLPIRRLSRNVKAAFAEIVIPVFSNENGFTGMRELTISAAGRVDDYSDVGSTFNPKIGVTYKPADWLRLRGSWGTSFNAPSLADTAAAAPFSASYTYPIAFLPFLAPPANLVTNGTYAAPQPYQTILVLQGNDPNIKPQKATTYSFGGDIQPAIVPGLKLSASYWNINFTGAISTPPITVPSIMYGNYGRLFTFNPTAAQEAAAIGLTPNNSAGGNRCYTSEPCVYAILNFLKTNLGDFRMNGLDFSADYAHETGFGSISFGVGGTYELNRQSRPGAGSDWLDELKAGENPRFRATAYAGAQVGKLHAQATLYHRGGYSLPSPVGLDNQTKVSSFNLVDLYFRYNVPGEGVLAGVAVTLNVNNAFNQSPPEYSAPNSLGGLQGFTNGYTVGRIFQFGVEKKF